MFIVVAYDVVDDKRRSLVAKIALDYGRRVQKSVFECVIDDRQFQTMQLRLECAIDMSTDSVRYYVLCGRCRPATRISGMGTFTDDDNDSIIIV